jgi:hypothetical protein
VIHLAAAVVVAEAVKNAVTLDATYYSNIYLKKLSSEKWKNERSS